MGEAHTLKGYVPRPRLTIICTSGLAEIALRRLAPAAKAEYCFFAQGHLGIPVDRDVKNLGTAAALRSV